MSANVELVRRSFEAISAWDLDSLLRLYDRDVEFLPLTGTRVESGGYRGHEGVRAYFEEARDLWEVLEPEGHEYEDLGDRVLVAGRCRVRGRASGAESEPACAWVIGVREGRIVSHRVCETYDEALRAAGVERSRLRAADHDGGRDDSSGRGRGRSDGDGGSDNSGSGGGGSDDRGSDDSSGHGSGDEFDD